MSIMKRAMIYLGRKKGRTIALLLLLFLMSCFVLVGISFKQSTESEMDRLRRSLASGFFLKVNTRNEMYHEYVDYGNGIGGLDYAGPIITEELIAKICSMDGVEDYIVNTTCAAWTNLKLRPGMFSDYRDNWDREELEARMTDPPTEEELMCKSHEVDLYPLRNGALHKNFRSGALIMAEGRNIEPEDRYKVVISDWLAENNHLSVGDSITFETKEGSYAAFPKNPMKRIGVPVEVRIAGLYHAVVSLPYSKSTLESSYMENVIYTDAETVKKLEGNLDGSEYAGEKRDGYIEVEFIVEDPGKSDTVMQQIKSREDLNLENMELEVDHSAYQTVAKPYRQIRIFAMLLLTVGICGPGVILSLVLKLLVRGRKHEIGILYAIGMKKKEILGQMLTECMLLSVVALILAFILSGPLVNICANAAERLTAPKADAEEFRISVNVVFEPVIIKTSSEQAVLEHTVSAGAILFMVLLVCGISGISVLLSFAEVRNPEVKKLLMLQ